MLLLVLYTSVRSVLLSRDAGCWGCCGVLGVLQGAGGDVGCCRTLWDAAGCCGTLWDPVGCCGVLQDEAAACAALDHVLWWWSLSQLCYIINVKFLSLGVSQGLEVPGCVRVGSSSTLPFPRTRLWSGSLAVRFHLYHEVQG